MSTIFRPQPLAQQTIVITGATSLVGHSTAQLAARQGAKVVLFSHEESELKRSEEAISLLGGTCLSVLGDVTKLDDLLRLKESALASFGRIDTWINAASTLLDGYLIDGELEIERAVFDINFWGTRMASGIAVRAMGQGGVLVNLGAEIQVHTRPLMGIYSASKEALKIFTESLRSEIKDQGLPVSVSLVRPNILDEPDATAEALLRGAVSPQRDIYVGGPARLSAIIDTFFPKVKDIMTELKMKELRTRADPEQGSRI